ncbi:PREDICTED: uncharacterized protein LOC105361757 isoform X2 [Ceratosolen solmsi marchali]|uniref:Uncharacterized protein LOC105361757 isoform X2 n=1 Tax=Ceratosolen solmsi marchali TaxID=326594 RepID=A0AAJ6YFW7_9HYME|nr:PREDICTED: uncharacterized protein LOC105361757 isoform X2 [Ceratosolen solmsi marchali]
MDDQERESARLDLDSIRELIAKEEPEVEITSLEEAPGSGRGDNYTSMLYRLSVKGRKFIEPGDHVPWERSIIYKVLPESKERREAFKSELLFRNEVVFYTRVWPALAELQANGRTVFEGVAKVYVARAELIAMEDLRAKGFKMADRRQGLKVDKLKRVLKALAGFHALSLTLKDLRPEVFARLSRPDSDAGEAVQEALFRMENVDWYRQYYRTAKSNALKMVSEGLPESIEVRRDEILGKFRAFLDEDSFFRTMCELTSSQGPLSVFCHGDCWTNNFLFKEDAVDSEAVCLVDFQLTRVGSLALDLANVLYCCTSGEVRKTFMTQLLQHYHRHLMSALYVLNPAAESTRDPAAMWTLLSEEMRRCGRFGLGLALDILPISTCTSDQAPDLYKGQEASDEERSLLAPPPAGAQCTRLMTDLVVELVNNRAL